MTDQIPHDMPGGDRSEFCPECGQLPILEGCKVEKGNAAGERPHERHMLMSRDRRWDVEAQSTWGWVEEGQR